MCFKNRIFCLLKSCTIQKTRCFNMTLYEILEDDLLFHPSPKGYDVMQFSFNHRVVKISPSGAFCHYLDTKRKEGARFLCFARGRGHTISFITTTLQTSIYTLVIVKGGSINRVFFRHLTSNSWSIFA